MLLLLATLLFGPFALAQSPVECDGPCHPSVGLLVQLSPEGVPNNQCTATLVAPDVMLTNTHCLPPALRRAGSDCAGKVRFHFGPDSANYEMESECSEVIYASSIVSEQTNAPDYAFLRLERPLRRPFLQISRRGFSRQETKKVYKINPVKNEETGETFFGQGRMTQAECATTYDPVTYISNTPLSPIVFLRACRIIPGNSGSALVGSDGMIQGIVASISTRLQTVNGREEEVPLASPRNKGTNFACLREPSGLGFSYVGAMDPACTRATVPRLPPAPREYGFASLRANDRN